MDTARPLFVDDGRTWWVLGAETWPTAHVYEAPNARSALVAYRRDLADAERSDGRSRRDIRDILAAARLHVIAGPLSTDRAYRIELAQALAAAATRWSRDTIAFDAAEPISDLDLHRLECLVGPDRAARIRERVSNSNLFQERGTA